MRGTSRSKVRGFTLVELLVTVGLIGIAAAVVLPLATVTAQRAKEAELRVALRTIRTALDTYKTYADAGLIAKPTGSSGYPADLDVLVTGVPRTSAAGGNGAPLVLLRRVPRDPFAADQTVPASTMWSLRSYGSPPGDFARGPDVYDVSSKSTATALDGSKLSEW